MQSLPRIHGNRQTEIQKQRNMSFGSLKGPKKGQQMNFYGLIKSRKRSIFEKKQANPPVLICVYSILVLLCVALPTDIQFWVQIYIQKYLVLYLISLVACVAWRFWLGEQSNKGGRGQRKLEEIEVGALSRAWRAFLRLRRSVMLSNKNPQATQAISLSILYFQIYLLCEHKSHLAR